MSDILVTQAAVRKLAAALSNPDNANLRHTERLDLIASAFGWKTDAFMHALKKQERSGGVHAPHDWAGPLGVSAETSEKITDLMECLVSKPGIVVVGGPFGSGKTTTILHMSRFLEDRGMALKLNAPGYVDWDDPDQRWDVRRTVEMAKRTPGHTYIIDELRSAAAMAAAMEIASAGNVVLTTLAASSAVTAAASLVGVHRTLQDKGRQDVFRGIVSQRLVRKSVPSPEGVQGEYRGRFMVADVLKLEMGLPDEIPRQEGVHDELVADILRAVEIGRTDSDEVERNFGSHALEGYLLRLGSQPRHVSSVRGAARR
ncbi:ATPase, T2SS/T4P/T4SS family [Pararhizobium sp. BT-229]|uniref:ATPase, T2SS/T4P/T4SS family n=1 Tax=Pararhizobium sp. BT-229 TaxID=2986923 RepID=UPI0021F78280|nr:ATPase, T2SS/T4P/T4SS family [Pararhizobium sp. BT-229]MCV9964502.1 ATPase, T2SS/T4P/T4SS family [Pararhizobium sp. BT-229]